MSLSTVAYTGLAGLAVYFVSRWWKYRIPRGLKRPPGPPGHLLIGNLLDLPKSKEWLTFDRWAKQYGDMFYLSMPGVSMLFVNSYELARELFDKRGSIYSDRFQSTVMNDLLHLDRTFAMAQYGEKWRVNRAYFHQFFGQNAIGNYHDVLMKYSKVLMKRLYRSPEDYRTHIRYAMGASIMEASAAYGIQAKSEEDHFLVLSETTVQRAAEAGVPGTYLVDIFPALNYIPSWFPGARFKRELSRLGEQVTEMFTRPVEAAKNNLRNGDARPSAISGLIEVFESDLNRPKDYEDIIKHVVGVAYIGAIDTTNGVLLHFFYTMLLHPEVQKRAQEELDEVVGPDALPSLEDYERLNYTRAVFQEILRWNAVTPAGIPHVLNVDDAVNGYFIPKGTIVFGNSWTLLRSQSIYGSDADKFKPERFLDEKLPLPDFVFGYGRRACPGRHFGESAAFMTVANVLHLFQILPFEGENGPELPAEDDFDSGVVLQPKPFRCRIVPRSFDAIRVLEELDP